MGTVTWTWWRGIVLKRTACTSTMGRGTPGTPLSGTDITADNHDTFAVALGDVGNGDGDLGTWSAGNRNQTNRLYLNDGGGVPGTPSAGPISPWTTTTHLPRWEMWTGTGDLDLVAGNYGMNCLYLNRWTGTAGHRQRGPTSPRTATQHMPWRWEMWMGTVTWTWWRGIINMRTVCTSTTGLGIPGDTVSGTDITADSHDTYALALGDVDGDGYLEPGGGE